MRGLAASLDHGRDRRHDRAVEALVERHQEQVQNADRQRLFVNGVARADQGAASARVAEVLEYERSLRQAGDRAVLVRAAGP